MKCTPLLCFALALSLAACGSPQPAPDATSPNIGDTVLLMSPDGKLIPGATSAEAYQASQNAFAAKDGEGIAELLNAGVVFDIPSGSTARLLGLDDHGARIVRMLDGQNQGEKAWVFGELIHAMQSASSTERLSEHLVEGDPTAFLDTAKGSDSAKAFLRKHWDAILATCPGLLTYEKDLSWGGIDDRSDPSYQDNVRGIGISLIASEHPSSIPLDFRAFGHRCSYRVTSDEQHLISEKTACTQICLERKLPSQEGNLLLPLRQFN